MNRNIVNINQVADETAAGSSQTAMASMEVVKQSTELQQLVGQFQI